MLALPPTMNSASADVAVSESNDTVTMSPTAASVLTLLFDEITKPLKLDGDDLSNTTTPLGAFAAVVNAPPAFPTASDATMLYVTLPSLSPDTSTYVQVTL